MKLLLPPSEAKAPGGNGPALDLDELGWPELNPVRRRLARTLDALGRSPRRAREVLGLGAAQEQELAWNQALEASPTAPVLERYVGVLYDALDVVSLPAAQRRRAESRLVVASALFGLLRARDPIPPYRLSGGTRLPRIGTLGSLWRPVLRPAVAALVEEQLVVDLRSGPYRALANVPGMVTVRVLSERPDGSRSVVSHANKATKGRLARLLATAPVTCGSVDDVERLAADGGLLVERVGPLELDLVVEP